MGFYLVDSKTSQSKIDTARAKGLRIVDVRLKDQISSDADLDFSGIAKPKKKRKHSKN